MFALIEHAAEPGATNMKYEALRKALKGKPFVPFILHLSHGRKYKITDPDRMLIPPVYISSFVIHKHGGYMMLRNQEVLSLEFVTTRKKRRRGG